MLRRSFTLGVAGVVVGGCSSKSAAPGATSAIPAAPSTGGSREPTSDWRTLSFEASADTPDGEEALLFAPADSASWPTLVALHGRGEAGRGLSVGSHGWRDDYALESMHRHLREPPLTSDTAGGFLDEARLAAHNRSLSAQAYLGLVIACPYTPVVTDPSADGAEPFARFVIGALLSKVGKETGAGADRGRTGIDGVSMGGRLALLVGLRHPEAFASVGALQPAIRVEEADVLAELAQRANEKATIALRLVSSDGDPFLEAVRAFSAALDRRNVAHGLVVTQGPHDYVWNKGPGSAEMLMFHERVLRGLPPP